MTSRKRKVLLYGVTFVTGLSLGIWATNAINQDDFKEQMVGKIQYRIPVELQEAGRKVGITDEQLIATHAQLGADPGSCSVNLTTACYQPDTKTIRLFGSAFNPKKNIVGPEGSLAYEYSHYIWQGMTQAEKKKFRGEVDKFYKSNQEVIDMSQGRLFRAEGGVGSEAYYDEMHAIMCSETSDNLLSPYVLTHCSNYLPHREILEKIY
jgi:hypothetical protein